MNPSVQSSPPDYHGHARLLLRALLDPAAPRSVPSDAAWPELAHVARRNGVLVRTTDRFRARGRGPDMDVWASVAQARDQAFAAAELVGMLSEACTRSGIEHVFVDSLEHFPDPGQDIDLLLAERSPGLDARILKGMGAVPIHQDFSSRVAGASRYRVWGCELDIRHGRLGALGEDSGYARVVLARRQRIDIAGVEFFVPAAADRIVLQGLQRVYARRRIRLANVLLTLAALRTAGGSLPWDQILERSRQLGVLSGLSCYLSYVEQIHADVLGRPLLSPPLRHTLLQHDWGRVVFSDDGYHFPTWRVNGRLYLTKLGAKMGSHSWDGAGRLFLLPLVAATSLLPRGARA